MRRCIDNCLACLETKAHRLRMGGEHASPDHQGLLADCSQACITSADFMLRMSTFHTEYFRICADVCRACGDDCARLAGRDETMMQCVDACRRCEQTCREWLWQQSERALLLYLEDGKRSLADLRFDWRGSQCDLLYSRHGNDFNRRACSRKGAIFNCVWHIASSKFDAF